MKLILLVVAFLSAHPATAAAQAVVGRVTDAETGEPLRGVFVVLADSSDAQHARALTGADGRYSLRGPGPGVFTVRAELIGYATARERATLVPGETGSVDIRMGREVIQLQSLTAQADRRCTAGPAAGAATARLWDEVRKALEVAAWVGGGDARFRMASFQRDLDLKSRQVGEQQISFETTLGSASYTSTPIDTLLDRGFAYMEDGQMQYNGPDAELLLSEEFLDAHCFSVTRRRDRRGMIGLAFEPLRTRRQTGIRGALWVDEASGALRFVEYQFTNLQLPPDAQRLAGGRTDFVRLQNGAWVVSEWHISMPRSEPAPGRLLAHQLAGVTMAGGELLGVELPGEQLRQVNVTGSVFDSVSMQAATGARLIVEGTNVVIPVDETGGFSTNVLTPGDYYVSVDHPLFRALPRAHAPQRVSIGADGASGIHITTPGRAAIIARSCNAEQLRGAARTFRARQDRLGVVHGVVLDDASGEPIRGARITVRVDAGAAVSISSVTDADGRYIVCGAPERAVLRAELPGQQRVTSAEVLVELEHGFMRHDFRIRATR